MDILISLPNLINFRVNSFFVSDATTNFQIISSKHNQLKRFHISLSVWNGSGHFSYYCRIFNCVLPFIPKLTRLSINLTMKCSEMNTDSAIGVLQLLTTIAEHLPIDCYFDCNLPCQTGERRKQNSYMYRSYWDQQGRLFISRINRIKLWLSKKHPTFNNLRCRRISKQYVEVSNNID
jgi:hypothetical protein